MYDKHCKLILTSGKFFTIENKGEIMCRIF